VIRILSGSVLIALVLAAIWYAPDWLFLATVAAIVVVAFVEYAGLAAKCGLVVPRAAGAAAAVIVTAVVGWPDVPTLPVVAAAMVGVCLVVLGANQPGPHVPGAAAAALFPVLYIGLPLGLTAAIRTLHGRDALLFVLGLVIASDTAQFYIGSWLGRHRMAPLISPKKSVEGAVAGLVAGGVVGGLAGMYAWPELGRGWLVMLGLVLAALGIAGDLFESLLKRSAEVKDVSALIPGHGGVLDRIDALLLVVPVYFIFLKLLN
jgi:phosphatidate cytidylyltransferase